MTNKQVEEMIEKRKSIKEANQDIYKELILLDPENKEEYIKEALYSLFLELQHENLKFRKGGPVKTWLEASTNIPEKFKEMADNLDYV